jgi:hypothetical protein
MSTLLENELPESYAICDLHSQRRFLGHPTSDDFRALTMTSKLVAAGPYTSIRVCDNQSGYVQIRLH